MSITLYGVGPSRSFRCLWALHEAGLAHKYVSVNLSGDGGDGAKSVDYLKNLNSQGKVPTLRHGDFVLTESAAIVNYINDIAQTTFIPREPQARARYDELAFFILSELEQPLWTNGKHRFAIPEEHRVSAVLKTSQWEFEKALTALAKFTDLKEYAIENRFTFADVLLAHTFNWAERFKFPLPLQCLRYRDRMYAREAAIAATAELKFE